jgi:hypothetical protein
MATKLRKEKARRQVKQALRKVTPEDIDNILKEQEEIVTQQKETKKDEPGSTRPDSMTKVPWTWRALCDKYPIVEIFPQETEKFNYCGIDVQLIAGAVHYVPEPFKSEYLRKLSDRRRKPDVKNAQGFETIVELGAGPLP